MSNLINDDKVVAHIYETHDYGKFSFIRGNRDIVEKHVMRLMDANLEGERIDHVVQAIKRGDHLEILDGQNYFTSCKELNAPVRYWINTTRRDETDEQIVRRIIAINGKREHWNQKNYLKSYCELGKDSYIKLRDFIKIKDISCIDIALILLGNDGSSHSTAKFKDGFFEIGDEKIADKRIKLVDDFKKAGIEKAWNKRFVRAACWILSQEKFCSQFMIKQLKRVKVKELVSMNSSIKTIKEALVNVYNYGVEDEDKLDLPRK